MGKPSMISPPPGADRRSVVMLGVHPASKERGGIASVVDVYRAGGLFDRWPILYVGTFRSGSLLTKIGAAVTGVRRFLGLLWSGRVALVHAHTASRASFWRKSVFMMIALAAQKPIILHLHGAEFETFYYRECGVLRRSLVRFVLSRVDRVVVLSKAWQELVEKIAPDATVVKIFNPITAPDPRITETRRDNVLLFLGRLGPRKGIFDLLEALVVIKRRFPAIRLCCGGDGDVAGVRIRAQALGVEDCVEMLGWVKGDAKDRALAEAAVFVLPTYAEGLPMGLLEAMASGAPIVATPVGGIPDAIEDGVDGFLVEPGNVEALSARIMALLENAEMRQAFSAAARIKAERLFGASTVLAQVGNLYRSLGVRSRSAPERENTAAASAARTQG